ncbi:MAG: hypothetical protein HQL32_01330 [Planctomycetes bacterium]|nr:hypothetical protein [Planctomycetota bacterium]
MKLFKYVLILFAFSANLHSTQNIDALRFLHQGNKLYMSKKDYQGALELYLKVKDNYPDDKKSVWISKKNIANIYLNGIKNFTVARTKYEELFNDNHTGSIDLQVLDGFVSSAMLDKSINWKVYLQKYIDKYPEVKFMVGCRSYMYAGENKNIESLLYGEDLLLSILNEGTASDSIIVKTVELLKHTSILKLIVNDQHKATFSRKYITFDVSREPDARKIYDYNFILVNSKGLDVLELCLSDMSRVLSSLSHPNFAKDDTALADYRRKFYDLAKSFVQYIEMKPSAIDKSGHPGSDKNNQLK